MVLSRVHDYQQKFADQTIRFNPYAIKKTGLVQAQTLLKIEDLVLICAPYQLSMSRVVLLAILSSNEISFFQQYRSRLAVLTLAFQKPTAKTPMNLPIRGKLERIGPVKGRNNVCLIEVVFNTCPNDLVEIIGDFVIAHGALKSQFENFKDRAVAIDPVNARTLRFNNYVECYIGNQKVAVRLASLAVNRLVLELPLSAQRVSVGQVLPCKLFFQPYQFMINTKVDKVAVNEKGRQQVSCTLDFSPELVEIMDDYFFRLSFRKD
jgi:hypothetical protein